MIVEGMEQIDQRIQQIHDRIADPTKLLQYGQRLLSKSIAQNFLQGGRPVSWPPRVSDVQGRLRRLDKQTHPLLRKTGRLANSAVSTNNGGESVSRIVIGAPQSSLSQGTTVEYAVYHNSAEPRNRLPRRAFLLFQPEDLSTFIAYARIWYWWGYTS